MITIPLELNVSNAERVKSMNIEAYLTDQMGNDLTVVNAARVSFKKAKLVMDKGDEALIQYLADHGHWTPFAHPHITFHVKAPVFVRTQCFKHKVGFVENEISRRYVDDEPEFFAPVLRQRSENKKQGSKDEFPVNLDKCDNIIMGVHSLTKAAYLELIKEGVAPEQARMVLPQSMMTEWYWTGSLAAFARFYNQRNHEDAQVEIRQLAQQIGERIKFFYPISWKALTKCR